MRPLIFMMLLVSTALVSCKKDSCNETDCNNGVCNDGTCICTEGFEGANCEVEHRSAFLGSFSVEESCSSGNLSYTVVMSESAGAVTELVISNFGDFSINVVAKVSGTSLSIDHDTGNGATIIGTGRLENDWVFIDYTMTTTANQTLNCNMVCSPL